MTELELIEKAASKRVLFCGERIIDVYNYVKPLGRPTKDAIVSVELVSSESFEGGVTAAAAHAIELCRTADCYVSGDVYAKQRWIEASHHRKLFECYVLERPRTVGEILHGCEEYSATIVTDYGHGMSTPAFISALSGAKYLAINVQTNSGNYGFNLATKYKHADYLCVDEPEARLATQNRSGPIEESLAALGSIAPKVVVTLGKQGAIGLQEGVVSRQRAFTGSVVDTIGAGDAFFAITALVAAESDMPSLLRIGNAAGAIKAGIVGHQRAVTKNELIDYLARIPA
jgi:hypothetical protein